MDDGDIPKAFDKAWSALSAEQKDKLNQENQMDLGSSTFAKFIHLEEADAEVYEELRNEVLALETPAMEVSSDENIDLEVSPTHNSSNDSVEGSDYDDAEIELDYDFNNNSDRDESADQKEGESTNATDEESDGKEHEKDDANSSYSFEEVSISDITEQEMPGDAKAEGSKNEMRRHMSSPPHVLPRHMVEWSEEMEKKYEKVAKMHSETLKQMIALQIKVDNHINPRMHSEAQKKMLALKIKVENNINPRNFKRPREDDEDAE